MAKEQKTKTCPKCNAVLKDTRKKCSKECGHIFDDVETKPAMLVSVKDQKTLLKIAFMVLEDPDVTEKALRFDVEKSLDEIEAMELSDAAKYKLIVKARKLGDVDKDLAKVTPAFFKSVKKYTKQIIADNILEIKTK